MDDFFKKELESVDIAIDVNNVFGMNTDDDASDCFRKIKALKTKKAELQELAEREISRINTWLNAELNPLDGYIEHFTGEIIAYYKAKTLKNPKAKVSTPYGKVTVRKSNKWYYDEPVVMEYLKANNTELIRVKEELDKASIKKLYKDGINQDTGEVVPGISIEAEETITVKEVD